MKILKLIISVVLLLISFGLIVTGTSSTSVDRYLVPPEILPGIGLMYFCAAVTALFVATSPTDSSYFGQLRAYLALKIGKPERANLLRMFFLLSLCIIGFSFTTGSTPMYKLLTDSYVVSLLINLLTSIIAAIGLFGWISSLLISKE